MTLSCKAGTTAPPTTCSPSPLTLTPANRTPSTLTAEGGTGDYSFNLQGAGSDTKRITHTVPVTLHVINFGLTAPYPATLTIPRGTTSSPASFQVTAAGSFQQSVAVSCSVDIANATCALTPDVVVHPTSTTPVNMTVSVTVPMGTEPANYTATIHATTDGAPTTLTRLIPLDVTSNPDFILTGPASFPQVNAGSTGTTGKISITSQDGFSGIVALSCPATYGAGSCSISPVTVSSFPAEATSTINGNKFTSGTYTLSIS